jgi:putative transposase
MMPRRQRIHVPGGTYYVVRRTHSPRPIFSRADDYSLLEGLLPAALRRTGAGLLGYCWMPDAIHMAVQIDSVPVGDFMRELASRYAQSVHLRTGERGQFFRRPYESTLIDSDAYLRMLIHYLHYIPVLAGFVPKPDDYPHSSHRAYLGGGHHWLQTRPVLQLIDSFDDDRIPYRRLMAEAPPATIKTQLELGDAKTPGILGDSEFIARLPRRGRPSCSKWSLDEIAAHVARTHDVPPAHLLSRCRRRQLVLARAQIAWYATERRVASLGEVARYLGHSASALTRAITRHQQRQPELFRIEAFAPMYPLAFLGSSSDNGSAERHRANRAGREGEIPHSGARGVGSSARPEP